MERRKICLERLSSLEQDFEKSTENVRVIKRLFDGQPTGVDNTRTADVTIDAAITGGNCVTSTC